MVIAHIYPELLDISFLSSFWVSVLMLIGVIKICVVFNAGSG